MAFGRVGAFGAGFSRLGAGGHVSAAPVGGAGLLVGEANGFAVDFDWPVDAQRVAVKTAGTVVSSGLSFLTPVVPSGWEVPSASIHYSAAAGSWWFDVDVTAYTAGARILGTTAGNAPIHLAATTQFAFYDNSGAYAAKTVSSVLGRHKVAIAFQAADAAITADGLAVATNTGSTAGTLGAATMYFGNNLGAADFLTGVFHAIRYVPRRKSNAELTAETV